MCPLFWNSEKKCRLAFHWHSTLTEEVAIARFKASPEMTGYWFKNVNSWQAEKNPALILTFNFSIPVGMDIIS